MHGCVRRVIGADFRAERLRGMEDGDPERESHEEAANVGEVVKAWKEPNHKADDDVEGEEEQFFAGGLALGPVPEEVEEYEGDYAKEGARAAAVRGVSIGRILDEWGG